MREGRFCATLFRTARNCLILNGEMSEWSIEHAWKACRSALRSPPTELQIQMVASPRNQYLRAAIIEIPARFVLYVHVEKHATNRHLPTLSD